MDTRKISFQRLINILAIIWVIVLIIAFFGFRQKFSFGQLVKDVVLKEQKLPLLVMAQGDNKPLPGESGFTGGRVIVTSQVDYAFIGPYWPLLPGKYQVRWHIVPDCEGHLGYIDVVSRLSGSEYGKMELVGQKAGEAQTSTLDFTADFSWNYETRMSIDNACSFKVMGAELVREKLDWAGLWGQVRKKL